MKIQELTEWGRIVKGVNTTPDVGVGQIPIEASKFGNTVDKDGRPPTMSTKVKGKSTNVLFNLGLTEGIRLKLERDKHIDVLHIWDTKEKHRVEVRGKKGYETNGYDPMDKLHQVLDRVGKAASVSDLMNGDIVDINPHHPQGARAIRTAKDVLTTEDAPRYTAAEWAVIEGGHSLDDLDKPTPTIAELVAMHGVPAKVILDQLTQGIQAEYEHTSDFEVAKQIAMDHLGEDPYYYDKLKFIENFANDKKNESISGDEMLSTFQRIHHDSGMNPSMDKWVKSQEWGIDTISPNDIVEFEDLFDYDDPFDRIIDVDESQVRKYITAIKAGRQLDPIILGPQHKDGKYSIVDGNHRALAYAALGKDIPVYMPMGNIDENFADGKKKGKSRPGRVKKAGASCNGSVTDLRKRAKKYSGERGRMYHWCANMKSGRKKK